MGCLERQSHTGAWTHDTTQHKKLSDLPPGINLFEHSQRWSLEAAHIQSRSYNSCEADPSSLASIVNAAQRQAMDLHIGFSTCECLAVEPGSFCGRSTCAMKGYGPSLSNIVSFLYLPVVGRPDGTLRLSSQRQKMAVCVWNRLLKVRPTPHPHMQNILPLLSCPI